MLKKLGNFIYVLICSVLVFQLVGCGTIMYPERKGQKGGRIDVGVAVLDGIGLLFFFIPGIIAYAVDFNNGTIYLPGGLLSSLEINNIKEVKFDPKHTSIVVIEKIIENETGYDVNLYKSKMQIVKLKSSDDIKTHFAQTLPGIQDGRIVLLNK